MTKFFVDTFKKTNQCGKCKKDKVSGYSLCPQHLALAKFRFRNWSNERRGHGLCVRCDSKSFNGWLRCETHTKLNRKNCLAWGAAHPERSAEDWKARKAQYSDQGLCLCAGHPKLTGGYKRCANCRERGRARGA